MENIAIAPLDEKALVDRALAQPSAFAEIYDQYVPRVYTYVRYRVDDTQTADDLVAQTFEQALRNLGGYRVEQAPFGAWLFGIAHHVVSRHYRSKNRQRWLPLDMITEHESNFLPPEDIAIRNETNHRLVRAVAQLPDRERNLIALKFAGGLTNRQIAEVTGLSKSNVGIIVYRSLKQLRGILSDVPGAGL